MSIDEDRFEVSSNTAAADQTVDLHGHTLVLPCVSIGSVPQLTVDVLLASSALGQKAVHVCDLDHRLCLPFIGAQPGDANKEGSSGLRTALQVFAFPSAKLTVVQQRSPVLKARKADFIRLLGRWIASKGFSDVVILSSLDAGLRTDAQMLHPFWHWQDSRSRSANGQSPSDSLSATLTAKVPSYAASTENGTASDKQQPGTPPPSMPAGGLVRSLLQHASLHDTWPTTVALLIFAAEGDNRADAMAMAQILLQSLPSTRSQPDTQTFLAEPSDWRLLYGPPLQPGMF